MKEGLRGLGFPLVNSVATMYDSYMTKKSAIILVLFSFVYLGTYASEKFKRIIT